MAIININLNPSARELRWFGLIVLAVFGLVGGLVLWRGETLFGAAVVWSIGLALAVGYYGLPPMRRPMYLAWMYAIFPVGWFVSHVLLGTVFFLLVTPIGAVMRLFGRDPMHRRPDPRAATYWVARRPVESTERYFRQF